MDRKSIIEKIIEKGADKNKIAQLVISNRNEIIRQLGKGAMGSVFPLEDRLINQ